jgi:3-hydroxy-3-methylglutaryl CoA synthase/uncharacterized OB-fold protein
MAIVAWGTYVPESRLDRGLVGAALGTPSGAGTRSVAGYDEDTTSMGVEAARNALADIPPELTPQRVLFATANPAYLDKTNATAIHAALGLPPSVAAFDVGGAVRSGLGAMMLATQATVPTLVVLSDIRTGLPGGADEREGGDGAAAFVMASEAAVGDAMQVRPLATASATAEFLDRWRLPGEPASHVWEERFGEHAYLPLVQAAFTDALKAAGIGPDALDHVIVTGVHTRAARAASRALGIAPDALVDDLAATIGFTGTAHVGLLLAGVLERAAPGQRIATVSIADGCDVVIGETTDRLGSVAPRRTLAQQAAGGRAIASYQTFLTWRGFLDREPPRRPDPKSPAAPPSFRAEEWKFGFTGSQCEVCGERHLPPARVCARCSSIDQMVPVRMADVPGTVATFTVDRLTYSPSPPLVAAVLDFDGGGRYRCELTDVDADTVAIGDRVAMTFRRISTSAGVHNYFWKARPIREGA